MIDLAKAAFVLSIAFVCAMTWLNWKWDQVTLEIYKGFDDDQLADVVDSKRMVRFYSGKYGSAAAPSDFFKGAGISKVCLDQPYGLPAERLSLNGLAEPDDGVSYFSFFVADGEHYYAVPLNRDFHIPVRGCRDPGSMLVSYQCTHHQALKYCLKWKDGE